MERYRFVSPLWRCLQWALAFFIALFISAILFGGCIDIPNTEEIVTECEAAAERARADATSECVSLVQEQVDAGREWLRELARALGCVQVIDPVDGPTSEWDCSSVCESAPDSVVIP